MSSDLRRILIFAIAGAVLMAAAGYGSALLGGPTYAASTLVAINESPEITGEGSASTEGANRFIQSQVLILKSRQFAAAMGAEPDGSGSRSVTGEQVGTTSVVEVRATDRSRGLAEALAESAARRFIEQLSQFQLDRISAREDAISSRLSALREASERGAAAPRQNAIEGEYQRLLAVASDLSLARSEAERAGSILAAGTPETRRLKPPLGRAAIWGLFGLLGGLAAGMQWRRHTPRLHTAEDIRDIETVATLAPPVPVIDVPASAGAHRHVESSPTTASLRLLAAQLASDREATAPSPVLLIAAGPAAETSFVAEGIATEIARRGETSILITVDRRLTAEARAARLHRPDVDEPFVATWTSRRLLEATVETSVPGLRVLTFPGDTATAREEAMTTAVEEGLLEAVARIGCAAVIDAPALEYTPVALECAPRAAHRLLVVGLGLSQRDNVAEALRLFGAVGAQVSSIVAVRPTISRAVRVMEANSAESSQSVNGAGGVRSVTPDVGAAFRSTVERE